MSDHSATPPTEGRSYLPAMGRAALLPLYDPMTRLLGADRAHRRLLAQAGIAPGHRVLEIGCGTGNLLLVAKRGAPRATVTGLDPDPDALARAARKAARTGLELHLDRGFADELPYPDASVDRVLSAFMLHHLPAAEKLPALREIRRVLAPGGQLHLLDLNGPTARWHRLLSRLPRTRGHDHGGHGHDMQGLLADNTSERILGLLTEAGLTGAAEVAEGRTVFGRYACFRAGV